MKLITIFLLAVSSFAFAQSPAKPEEMATVHIYRALQFTAKMREPKVFCDDAPLAKMQDGRYFAVKVPAGNHAFRSLDSGVGVVINAEKGKEYFIRVEMVAKFMKYSQQVTQVGEDQGRREISALKPLDKKKIIDNQRVLLQ